MMTLEEAIKHCKDVALSCTNKECALEHFQLLKWLQEYSNMLEKQSEQKPVVIIPKFRIGDEIKTSNEESLTITKIDGKGYWSEDLFICNFNDADKWELIEQKPADKVEPNFHEGEWIVDNCGYVWKIEGILNQFYLLEDVEGGESRPTIEWVDKTFHLWTIQDAKDGDVLACENGWTCIFNCLNDNLFSSHCFMDNEGWFCEDGGQGHTLDYGICVGIHPATKEQRDLLFQKMKEAGYEWDAEKKELKKIEDEEYNGEDYGIDSLYHAQIILEKTLGKVDGYQSDDGILEHKCAISAVKKLYEQKPAWSEEDEKNSLDIKCLIGSYRTGDDEYRLDSWIDSLKYRAQTKQEWSKEDEKMLDEIIDFFENGTVKLQHDLSLYASWLKSLKNRVQTQNTWKPSDEQMKSLRWVIEYGNTTQTETLKGIYEQLKKL